MNTSYWIKQFCFFVLSLCASACTLCADNSKPIGIIGGQGSAPYAALLYADGTLRTLQGLPLSGLTYRVAINLFGKGIIGGTSGLNAYAAFVSPKGVLTPITGLIAPGEIYSVAINNAGVGIIGGGHYNTSIPYAALIAPNGTATSFLGLPANGLIYSVAIDQSGEGIIGGQGSASSAYVALTSADGTLTPIPGLPTTGNIFWVSTNESKTRFIGGFDGLSAYAAFISPNGTLTPIAGLPNGQNYSVAINAKGNAIMGGVSLSLPYAALVSSNGSVKTLTGLPTSIGIIYTVTLNRSGTGLIAGLAADEPYGTFVAPDGTLTPLKGLPLGTGFLDGVALHSSGIGLVGGESLGKPFAALAAPNGKLTFLSGLPANGAINSTAFSALEKLVPKSVGLFNSYANTQFTLSNTLTQHCIIHHKAIDQNECGIKLSSPFIESIEERSLWLAIFGNYSTEKAQHTVPGFSNQIKGALVGFDYKEIQNVIVGGALSYAQNRVHYHHHRSHATINQESAVFYASLNKPHFYLNAALWGGIFQTSSHRHSFAKIRSKSNQSGWTLSPHLELSTPFLAPLCKNVAIEPFVMFDWAHQWQDHYREYGASGFNIRLNHQYASILRTELGCRFYESLQYAWGKLIFEEKLSYVNRTPLQRGNGRAAFVGANSSFDVITLNFSTQNLGSAQLHIECLPALQQDIYASFDYQAEFGSRYHSHLLSLTFGKYF